MKKNFLLLTTFILGFANAQNTIIFEENFSPEGTRNLWTRSELDGDGFMWEFYNDATPFGSCAISISNIVFMPINTDNILVSPEITLPSEKNLKLSFSISNMSLELAKENYSVYILPSTSTFTGNENPIFTEKLDQDYSEVPKDINLSIDEYVGQKVKVVFRHYKTDYKESMILKLGNVKVEALTLGTYEANKKQVSVYPNPTSDIIYIKGLEKVEKIRVLDFTGRILKEVKGDQINIANLPKGQYIVNFYTNNEVISRKILKK